MIIPHLPDLDPEELKDTKHTLKMLLQEAKDRNHANGFVCKSKEYAPDHHHLEWLGVRQHETEEISKAVEAEILRRFAELEERAKTTEDNFAKLSRAVVDLSSIA